MTITSRQFEQLSEMGISLWQKRDTDYHHQNNTNDKDYLPQSQQSLEKIAKQTIFTDILLSLGLTLGEISVKKHHLDVGTFNWYFLNEEHNAAATELTESSITYIDNKLVTPRLGYIAQSAILKKQLWHTIFNKLL